MPVNYGPRPFIPAPFTARCVVNQTLHGEQVLNIIHYLGDANWDGTTLLTLANQLLAAWNDGSGVGSRQSSDLTVQSVIATDIAVADGAQAVSTGASAAGQAVDTSVENSIACVATLRTGLSGRSNRGRLYMAGLPKGQFVTGDPNHLIAAAATALQAAVSHTINAPVVLAAAPQVVSFAHAGAWRATAVGHTVSSVSVNTRADNQRRRMPRS